MQRAALLPAVANARLSPPGHQEVLTAPTRRHGTSPTASTQNAQELPWSQPSDSKVKRPRGHTEGSKCSLAVSVPARVQGCSGGGTHLEDCPPRAAWGTGGCPETPFHAPNTRLARVCGQPRAKDVQSKAPWGQLDFTVPMRPGADMGQWSEPHGLVQLRPQGQEESPREGCVPGTPEGLCHGGGEAGQAGENPCPRVVLLQEPAR